MIKVGSDFSGVGAFNQALNRLGIDYEEVFACDHDKYARQTFIHNYGEPKYFPYDVYEREIPNESLDIYMTSPPCQAFSLAGKRLGVSEDRGILFYNSLEFIRKNRPRYFIFENVKGLISSEKGNTFKYWLELLGGKSINKISTRFYKNENSVDYHIHWKVLNAKKYGVPQNRERVFIIGIRDDEDNNFVFPTEFPLEKRLKDVLEDDVDDKYYLSEKMINYFLTNTEKQKQKNNGFKFSPTDGNSIGKAVTCRAGSRMEDEFIQIKSATSRGYEEASEGVLIAAIRGRETEDGLQQQLELGSEETSNSITTVQKDNVLVYKEFRTEEGKKKRKETGTNDFRDKDFGFFEQDYANTLTSGQKDNLIFVKENENKFRFYKDDYKKSGIQGMDIIKSDGIADTITNNHPGNIMIYGNKRLNETLQKHELPKDKVVIIDSYNQSIHEEASPTISTRVNASNSTHVSIPIVDDKITIVQLNESKESGGKQPYQQNRVYDSNGLCPALNAGQVTWGGNIITTPYDYRIRRLTPRECFRLMDFPDTFTWPVSDSQAYKQAGNSIVVNVLYNILKNLRL